MKMKRRLVALGLSALGLSRCAGEPAPELPEGPVSWSVEATAHKHEVQVGEDLRLTLRLTHPVEGADDYQPPPSSSFEPFEVIDFETETVSPVETRLHFDVAAYRLPESLEIPALEVRYRDEAGEVQVLTTRPIAVELVTSLTPDVTDIHDIKDPVALEVPRDWRLLWWLLLALLLALAAYLIYRKYRKTPELETRISVPPPPPADVEAEAALRRLAEKKLIDQGLVLEFFEELAEIMKRYAGRRFEVAFLERTTHEILEDLDNGPEHADLRAILEASDLVKFARLSPGPDRATGTFELAERYLARTRPKPRPETETETSGPGPGRDGSQKGDEDAEKMEAVTS